MQSLADRPSLTLNFTRWDQLPIPQPIIPACILPSYQTMISTGDLASAPTALKSWCLSSLRLSVSAFLCYGSLILRHTGLSHLTVDCLLVRAFGRVAVSWEISIRLLESLRCGQPLSLSAKCRKILTREMFQDRLWSHVSQSARISSEEKSVVPIRFLLCLH